MITIDRNKNKKICDVKSISSLLSNYSKVHGNITIKLDSVYIKE